MKIHILLVCAIVYLGGCAHIYDQEAFAGANAQQQLALAQCQAHVVDKTFTSVGQYVDCELAAERAMAVAVKLQRMDVFEAYAARMRLTAQQADSRQITPDQMTAQFIQAHVDFEGNIQQAVAYDAQKRARIAAALAGMAAAANAEADRQAYIQAHNPSLHCTSSKFGNTVTTDCN